MSEEGVDYIVTTSNTLLIDRANYSIMTQEQPCEIDLVAFERMLIPLLNKVRQAQGKKPVIIPKG